MYFRDLDMVEQLGSGIPRILAYYPKSSYHFSANFIRLVLPFAEGFEVLTGQATDQGEGNENQGANDNSGITGQAAGQAAGQAEKLLAFCTTPRSTKEMMEYLELSHREHFRDTLLLPLMAGGKLKMTIPDKPKSPKQRYIADSEHKDNG